MNTCTNSTRRLQQRHGDAANPTPADPEAPPNPPDCGSSQELEVLEVAFIRNGQTFGNANIVPPEGTARGDDMLTPQGIDEATLLGQDPAFVAVASTADAVLVSPLRRALHTAVLALRTDQVFNARQQRGLDGPIVLLLDADLRELNRNQRPGNKQGLYWRHRGTVLSRLRLEPCLNVAQERVLVDWDSAGPAMANNRIWWDHSDKSGEFSVGYWDAHWRAFAVVESVRLRAEAHGWRKICIFAHENTIRCMAGVSRVSNASMLECQIAAPAVVACSYARRAADNRDRHRTKDDQPGLQTTKAVPKALVQAVQQRGVSSVAVVLGCSDQVEALRRMKHGLQLMRQQGGCPLIYVGSPDEFEYWLTVVKQFDLPPHELQMLLGDQCSTVTECNIDQALALASAMWPDLAREQCWRAVSVGGTVAAPGDTEGSYSSREDALQAADDKGYCVVNEATERGKWVLRRHNGPVDLDQLIPSPNGPWTVHVRDPPLKLLVVTNGWHMPRAAMTTRDSLMRMQTACPALAGRFQFQAASCFVDPMDQAMTAGHLRDGRVLARRIMGPHKQHFEPMRRGLGRELREVGDNMRRWARQHRDPHAALQPRCAPIINAIKAGDRDQVCNLLSRAYQAGIPLAQVPVNERNGSTALHYAVSHGHSMIVHDLIYFWGAPPHEKNNEGKAPVDYASNDECPARAMLLDACNTMYLW